MPQKKRIMTKFLIAEISGVDRAAQPLATMDIAKRDNGELPVAPTIEDLEKSAKPMLTDADGNGHQHGLLTEGEHGELMFGQTTYEDGHSHLWVRNDDGSITIAEAHGHRHTVTAGISKGDNPMPDDNKIEKSVHDAVVSDLEKAQSTITDLNRIAALGADEFAVYKSLSEDDRDLFMKKTAPERARAVSEHAEALEKADPVMHTRPDGTEIRKSAGEVTIAAVKEADEANEKLAKADLEKRASEILGDTVTGTPEVQQALVKAVDGITDETLRDGAIAILKSKGDPDATKTLGVAGAKDIKKSDDDNTMSEAGDALDQMVQKYMADNSVEEPAAYDAVLKTAAGAELYTKSVSH